MVELLKGGLLSISETIMLFLALVWLQLEDQLIALIISVIDCCFGCCTMMYLISL